jgi:hypothetical protein
MGAVTRSRSWRRRSARSTACCVNGRASDAALCRTHGAIDESPANIFLFDAGFDFDLTPQWSFGAEVAYSPPSRLSGDVPLTFTHTAKMRTVIDPADAKLVATASSAGGLGSGTGDSHRCPPRAASALDGKPAQRESSFGGAIAILPIHSRCMAVELKVQVKVNDRRRMWLEASGQRDIDDTRQPSHGGFSRSTGASDFEAQRGCI